MARFTLRQLEYVVAAGEAGSVTLAARRAHASQPTVSAAIAQTEQVLGVQLFIRHHAQGLSLTPAGRDFVLEAGSLLRHAGELDSFAGTLSDKVSGPLRVGCLVTLAPLIAPRLWKSFVQRYPAVSVQLVETDQDGLLAGLRDGTLAAALTYDLELSADIAFQQLAELPPLVLLPAGHRFARRRRVGLEQLAPEPLVLLDLPLSREYFRSLFAAQGLEPVIGHSSRHPEVIRAMVANGFGYSIVNVRPLSDLALDGAELRTVAVSGEHRPMRLGIAGLRALRETRLVATFRSHCQEAVDSGSIPGLAGGPID